MEATTILTQGAGAFENYRYRDAMFPTSQFRIAYDSLKKRYALKSAAKRYLNILNIAAKESEVAADNALRILIDKNMDICKSQVQTLMQSNAWGRLPLAILPLTPTKK